MAPGAKRKLLVVDDHPVVCSGIRLHLLKSPDFLLCGEAANAAAALREAARLRPDLVLLDLLLGEQIRLDLVASLKEAHPPVRIIVYSMQDERAYARRSLRAGAHGYVMKSEPFATVIAALQTVAAGDYHVSPVVQRGLVREAAAEESPRPGPGQLSDREMEVFRLLGTGIASAEIARRLNLSPKTVGAYRERLKTKLQAATGRELERRAETFVETGKFPPCAE